MNYFTPYSTLVFLSIIVLSLFSGCGPDTSILGEMMEEEPFCLDSYGPGLFTLSDATIEKYPYAIDENIDSLIYANSSGSLLTARFMKKPKLTTFTRYPNQVPCREDSSQLIQVQAEYQRISSVISIENLEIGFVIYYGVNHDVTQYFDRIYNETGNIYVTSYNNDDYLTRPIPQMVLMVNENNRPSSIIGQTPPLAQVDLNGISYSNVYVNETGSDKFLLYYNYAQGLVGFEDQRDGITYNLVE